MATLVPEAQVASEAVEATGEPDGDETNGAI